MAKPAFTRAPSFAISPGRHGADQGRPGVLLSVLRDVSLVLVIARAGKSKAVKEALSGLRNVRVLWAGPDQYYVQAEGLEEGALLQILRKKLVSGASIIDQSHGRVVVRVAGPKARAVLAKGTPVDLHADEFPVGKSALTQMAHVGVHLTRVDIDTFELSVFRGFSESFWEWLCEMSLEFGYQVA